MMNEEVGSRLRALQGSLDVEFRDPMLLLQALTHRSALNEGVGHPDKHYERLEFLGDAIVEMVVTEMLVRAYPDEPEGVLTNWRAALVCGEALGPIGEKLGLHELAFFSRGERRSMRENPKARMYACACLFEALIGAVYFDQGLGACRMLIDHLIHTKTREMIASHRDDKSALQDYTQEQFGLTPRYEVMRQTGPDHNRHYEMACMVGDVYVARGGGSSKPEATKDAARKAFETRQEWSANLAKAVQPALKHGPRSRTITTHSRRARTGGTR